MELKTEKLGQKPKVVNFQFCEMKGLLFKTES